MIVEDRVREGSREGSREREDPGAVFHAEIGVAGSPPRLLPRRVGPVPTSLRWRGLEKLVREAVVAALQGRRRSYR